MTPPDMATFDTAFPLTAARTRARTGPDAAAAQGSGARGAVRRVAQPAARRSLDARHLVGHRVGGDAARVRQRLPERHHGRLPQRVRRRRGGALLRTDQPAGRRPARRPPHPAEARGRGGDRRVADHQVGEPRVLQPAADDLRRQVVDLRAARGERLLRHDARRTPGQGAGPLAERRGRGGAPARRLPGLRGRAQAVRRAAGRRSDGPDRRTVPSRSSG